MTLPISGDTYLSGGTHYHVLAIAAVDNEQLVIASTTTKNQRFPLYAKHGDEILMLEGLGVTKVQRIPTGEDENTVLPLSVFSETLPDGNLKYVRVDNYVDDEPVAESVEPVTEPVDAESLPEVEEVGEPESVPTAEATVEAVEKTEDSTEVDVAVSVPDEDETETES